jgi:hypothetical protein
MAHFHNLFSTYHILFLIRTSEQASPYLMLLKSCLKKINWFIIYMSMEDVTSQYMDWWLEMVLRGPYSTVIIPEA